MTQNGDSNVLLQGTTASMPPTNIITDHDVSALEKYIPAAEVKISRGNHCRSCKDMQIKLDKFLKLSKTKLMGQIEAPRGKALMTHLRTPEGRAVMQSAGERDDGREVTAMRFVLRILRARAVQIFAQKHGFSITSENGLLCRKCSGGRVTSFSPGKQQSMNKRSEHTRALSISSLPDMADLAMQVQHQLVVIHIL